MEGRTDRRQPQNNTTLPIPSAGDNNVNNTFSVVHQFILNVFINVIGYTMALDEYIDLFVNFSLK
jgi:hypothetical protein